MHSRILTLAALILLIALPAFAGSSPVRSEADESAVQGQELALAPLEAPEQVADAASLDLVSLAALDQQVSSSDSTFAFGEENTTANFGCNQGARCWSKNDPICGTEGYCNLPSRCCMCY